jgi:hypothetical protein
VFDAVDVHDVGFKAGGTDALDGGLTPDREIVSGELIVRGNPGFTMETGALTATSTIGFKRR